MQNLAAQTQTALTISGILAGRTLECARTPDPGKDQPTKPAPDKNPKKPAPKKKK